MNAQSRADIENIITREPMKYKPLDSDEKKKKKKKNESLRARAKRDYRVRKYNFYALYVYNTRA